MLLSQQHAAELNLDLRTYGLTEDSLINKAVSNVTRLCFSWSPLKNLASCADLTDVTINYYSSEIKKKFFLNLFGEYRK